jgi:predicted metal-binding protein
LSDESTTSPARAETRNTATVYVCVTCRRKRADVPEGFDRPGEGLIGSLEEEIGRRGLSAGLKVSPVECFAVCNRVCTVAFTAPGKWTHIVGNLDAEAHVADIVTTARKVAEAADGIVPWLEQPEAIRKGGIARLPPLGQTQGA